MAGSIVYEHHLVFRPTTGGIHLVLDPWADEFNVKQGQKLTVFVRSDRPPGDDPVEVDTDLVDSRELIVTVYVPSGSNYTRLELDGAVIFESG